MIAKLFHLHRMDAKNIAMVLSYLAKKALGQRPSDKETEIYTLYNTLIKTNSTLAEANDRYFILDVKGRILKKVKLRRKPSSDLSVFHQVFAYREYLTVAQAYGQHFSTSHALNIIDGGSNIGLTAVFFSDYFQKPNIVCVEPEPHNFAALSYNLDSPQYGKIDKVQGAIWSSVTRIKIVSDFRDQSDWAFRVEETTDADAIEAFTIDHLAEKNHFKVIDILKIDIEGSEKQLFGTGSDVSFLDKTKCIAIEIHDEFDCRQQIYDVLDQHGFSRFNHGELTIGINHKLKAKP